METERVKTGRDTDTKTHKDNLRCVEYKSTQIMKDEGHRHTDR